MVTSTTARRDRRGPRIALWALAAAALVASVPAATGAAPPAGRADPQPLPRIVVRQLGSARPGGYARIEVTYENVGGGGVGRIDFGDGTPGLESEGYDQGCGGISPGTGSEIVTHPYRRPGSWTVTVSFTPKCAEAKLPLTFTGRGTVTIQPGKAPSNGPATPLAGDSPFHCRAETGDYGKPRPPSRTMACYPYYEDSDGYLTKVVLRWGDGSPDKVFTFPLSRCVDPKDHWPATYVDEDGPVWGVQHRYPAKKNYRATVTATTAGCDGKDRQTRTASVRVAVE